jgi:hypothetical protein
MHDHTGEKGQVQLRKGRGVAARTVKGATPSVACSSVCEAASPMP